MNNNLIVPIAADKPEWNDTIPYMFDIHPLGNLMVFESIKGLNLKDFDHIYVSILRKHEERFGLKALLKTQFQVAGIADKLHVVILDSPTRNQPETIAKTIESENIEGHILIKDADNQFECTPSKSNSIGIFPLDALDQVNPSHKSYVAVDDSMYVTNIIENKIIGRYFCAGAYGFENASQFLSYYSKLSDNETLYLSHIIYAMLLDNIDFRPIIVKKYLDWGTKKEWKMYCQEFKTLFVPFRLLNSENREAIVKKINHLYATGKNRIVIVAEYNKLLGEKVEISLERMNIKYHEVVREGFLDSLTIVRFESDLGLDPNR